MRETPEILAISGALERPVGQFSSYGVSSIGGAVATILAATNHPQAAVKVASVGFMFLIVCVNLAIWKCGTALLRTIDRSLRNSSVNSKPNSPTAAAAVAAAEPEAEGGREEGRHHAGTAAAEGAGRRKVGGGPNLLAARKTIKIAMMVCLTMAVQTVLMLMFAVVTRYGTDAPLLFFGISMGLAPLLWYFLNVQMHAGRSNRDISRGGGALPGATSVQLGQSMASGHRGVRKPMSTFNSIFSKGRAVLPVETPASP